jgi:hypothetical protein
MSSSPPLRAARCAALRPEAPSASEHSLERASRTTSERQRPPQFLPSLTKWGRAGGGGLGASTQKMRPGAAGPSGATAEGAAREPTHQDELRCVSRSRWLAVRPTPVRLHPHCLRCVYDAPEEPRSIRGIERIDGRGPCSAAAGVRLAAVVRLAAACAELASLCLCHSEGQRTRRSLVPAGEVGCVCL